MAKNISAKNAIATPKLISPDKGFTTILIPHHPQGNKFSNPHIDVVYKHKSLKGDLKEKMLEKVFY